MGQIKEVKDNKAINKLTISSIVKAIRIVDLCEVRAL